MEFINLIIKTETERWKAFCKIVETHFFYNLRAKDIAIIKLIFQGGEIIDVFKEDEKRLRNLLESEPSRLVDLNQPYYDLESFFD